MKLKINKACDLASISVLPPRKNRGSGGRASASASAAAASQQRSHTISQQSFSQSAGASFSQGVGSGGASFSQGRGGGGAPFSQNSGGGGASFSQVGSGGAAFSQAGSGGAAFSQGGGSGGASFSQGGGGGGAALSQGGGGGGAFSQGRGAGGAAFSQNSGGGGPSFSQVSGGGASFSQGGGGGGASFSQGGGGGSASFSQGVGSGSLLNSHSQISHGSFDENLFSLHHPSPARDQRSALPDDSSKRMASFPANSASVVREESQLQLAKISSNCNPIHRWNPSLPDSRCQMNEDVERKFQHLASSVHKIGMVLDSVQNDVMQLNRAMKEASLDSDSIQKKFVLVENSVQQTLKGQDELKALLDDGTKSNPDLLSILNYHTSKLDEISQVQADLRQLKGDIFRILTKEMEGIVRAIRSFSSRPDPMEMLADRSCTTNEKPMMNRTPIAKGSPQMKERPVADDRPQMKQTPVANGRSQMNQAPVANGRPQMKRTPAANGRPQMKRTPAANGKPQMNHAQIANGISKMKQAPKANGKPLMKQIPVAKVLPAALVYQSKVKDLKPKVKRGKLVKAGAQTLVGSSCCRVAPKQDELAIQKVDPQVPTKKAPWSIIIDLDEEEEEEDEEGSGGSASCVILNTETGAGGKLMREEETSEEALDILRRARKRRRREESKAIVLFGQ